jgi:hypothetical protein
MPPVGLPAFPAFAFQPKMKAYIASTQSRAAQLDDSGFSRNPLEQIRNRADVACHGLWADAGLQCVHVNPSGIISSNNLR